MAALALALSTGACSAIPMGGPPALGTPPSPPPARPDGAPANAPAALIPSSRVPARVPSFAASVQGFRDQVTSMGAAPAVSRPQDLYDALGLLANALAVAPSAEDLGVVLLAREIETDVETLRAMPVGAVQLAGILDALEAADIGLRRLAMGPFAGNRAVMAQVRAMTDGIEGIGPEVTVNPPSAEVLRPLVAAADALDAMRATQPG